MTIVDRVVENRLEGTKPTGLGLEGLGLDEAAGYTVQADANVMLEQTLGPVVGHKIGATAAGMRQILNVPGPIAGDVFEKTVHAKSASLHVDDYLRPGIETEIAVRIARDLTPAEAPWTVERIAEAVAAVMPAIEIADDRYTDFKAAGAGTIIADNAFNAACILGPETTDWHGLTLDRLNARSMIDGEEVATGRSDELLGHPLNALVWLADSFASRGRTLEAGRFVSLGTITPVQWIAGPCEVEIEVEGLGGVRVVFA